MKLFGDQTIQKRVLAGKSFLPHCGLSYQLITNEVGEKRASVSSEVSRLKRLAAYAASIPPLSSRSILDFGECEGYGAAETD